jgi:hypothetical protein
MRSLWKRFQLVWWPHRWWMLWPVNLGCWPHDGPAKGCIYRRRLVFGPLEIREWAPNILAAASRESRIQDPLHPYWRGL